MIRNRRRLHGGIFGEGEEEISPMDGVSNLADVMLVFACGLMLALITHWNVDLMVTDISNMQEVSEEVDIMNGASSESSESGFNELGMAYTDPETGKVYVIVTD